MAAATAARRGIEPALALAIGVQVIWALQVVVVKWAVGIWESLAYAGIRFAVGGLLFAAFVLWREGSLRVTRRHAWRIALCSAIGVLFNQVTFMRAAETTTAATISLMMASAPAFAAIFAAMAGHERVGRRHWAGVVVAVLGVALILRGGGADLDFSSLEGDIWALLAASSFALFTVLLRPVVAEYSASRVSALSLLMGGGMLLVISWPSILRQDYGALGPGAWGALLYSMVIALLITNLIWFGAVRKIGAARVTALMPLQPAAGVVLAVLLLGESVHPLELLGGSIVIAGVLLTIRRRPAATTASAPPGCSR